MPNGIEMMELVLGAQQIGLYMTPINHHLVGPEIAYIVNDSDAKVLIGHERFADALVAAGDEIKLDADRRFAIGSLPGWRPIAELTDGPAHVAARGSHGRRADALHVGHDRPAQGREAGARTISIPTRAARCTRCS